MRQRRRALAEGLKPIQDAHARAGRLDEALAVRAYIRRLRGQQGVRPAPYALNELDDQPPGTRVRMACYTAAFHGELIASGEVDEWMFVGPDERDRLAPAVQAALELTR